MIELKEQTVEAAEWLGADSEEVGMGGGSVNRAIKKKIVLAVEETRSLLLTKITSPERPNSVLGWKQSLDFLFVDLVWHGYQPNKCLVK